MKRAKRSRYKAAIIGLGRVASTLEDDPLRAKPCTHAGSYHQSQRIIMVAGADRNEDKRENFKKRWNVKKAYEDYRVMLAKEKPDIVSITAYATERYQMFKDCVHAGVKAIWLEKAISTSLKQAKSMVRLAKKYHVTTVVNHPRRWIRPYVAAKSLIDLGYIGKPESITTNFTSNLLHTGTHAFDMMRFFFGEAKRVRGTPDPYYKDYFKGVSGYDFEKDKEKYLLDIGGNGTIEFENGAIGSVNGRLKKYFLFEFEMIGTEGGIRIGNTTPLLWLKPQPSKGCTGFLDLLPSELPEDEEFINRVQNLKDPVLDLIDGIEKGEESINSIYHGMKALEIGIAFHESFKKKGEWISLPLKKSDLIILSR